MSLDTDQSRQPEKRKPQKPPRSSRDFNNVIEGSGLVAGERQSGSHKTYNLRGPNGELEAITIIQGGRDLKDTNPKVWHDLVKKLKQLGILAFVAGAIAVGGHFFLDTSSPQPAQPPTSSELR